MYPSPIQLFDASSSTYTYILVSPGDGAAVIIDPVFEQMERDLAQLERLGLKLEYVLETHAHADHVTSAGPLRARTGARAGVPVGCGIDGADEQLANGSIIRFGAGEEIRALHTPGHTAGSMCYLWRDHLFSGDTLLIDGCGRTDFQGGSAAALYASVTETLFSLPDATRVWPGHDYQGRSLSTIGWEKRNNRRLAGRSCAEFVGIMDGLNLPRPKLMDVAVPANRALGLRHES